VPVGYVFHAKGDAATLALAERASRLASGTKVIIDYTAVTDGWNLGRGLTVS
jgi:hypothetical protein